MKRAKKLTPTILLLAFIIFAVGIGIHSLHRDAYADTVVTCYAFDQFDNGVEDIIFHVHFFLNDELVEAAEMDDDGGGFYSYTGHPQSQYDEWDIALEFGADPLNPAQSPKFMLPSQTYLAWKVDPD